MILEANCVSNKLVPCLVVATFCSSISTSLFTPGFLHELKGQHKHLPFQEFLRLTGVLPPTFATSLIFRILSIFCYMTLKSTTVGNGILKTMGHVCSDSLMHTTGHELSSKAFLGALIPIESQRMGLPAMLVYQRVTKRQHLINQPWR